MRSQLNRLAALHGRLESLMLTEFFLLLSSTGLAYRRCQLDRVNGDKLEVSFLHQKARKKPSREAQA